MKTEQRDTLLKFVTEHSSEEELLQLATDIQNRRQREANMLSKISSYLGMHKPKAEPVAAAVAVEQVTSPKLSRLGAKNKGVILQLVHAGPITVEQVAAGLKFSKARAQDILDYMVFKKMLKKTADGKYA